MQGISAGWVDVYDRDLDGQWIDVTGMPDGPYWLEVEVDPGRRILEGGEENNLAQVLIQLAEEPVASPGGDPLPPAPEPPSDPLPNRPPEVELLAPAAAVTWVEYAYEGLPLQWVAADLDGDDVSIALFVDQDRSLDAGAQPIGGYQNLPGESGQAVLNTAALELGTWYLHAVASDGTLQSGAGAPGSLVVYTKGDLDFDGHVDRADWVLLVQRRRALKGSPLSAVVAGWEQLLDLDRNGAVDLTDIDAFRSAALSADATHAMH